MCKKVTCDILILTLFMGKCWRCFHCVFLFAKFSSDSEIFHKRDFPIFERSNVTVMCKVSKILKGISKMSRVTLSDIFLTPEKEGAVETVCLLEC